MKNLRLIPVLAFAVLLSCGGGEAGSAGNVTPLDAKLASSAIPIVPADAATVMNAVREHKGDVVLLNMWATWCEPCIEEFPVLTGLHSAYADSGLTIIAVSFDFEEQIESHLIPFITERNADFVHFYQNDASDQVFIEGTLPEWPGALPATAVFDRTGGKVLFVSGPIERDSLEPRIRELLRK